jgi:cytochrome c biogenesis protein CcmG, thiol:disulfide interchange protein DsbE
MTRISVRRVFSLAAVLPAMVLSTCVEPPARVAVGERVPEYSASGMDGEQLSLQELRGEVVLLNVWATWCFPCRREMPAFEVLHREWNQHGLRVVAVSIDAAGATGDIRDFSAEYGLTFDILHDAEQRVTRAFQTIGVPETFLIDAEGRLRRHWIGRVDPHAASFREPIAEALNEAAQRYAGARLRGR